MLPSYFDCARRAAAKQFRKEIEKSGFALRENAPSVGAALGTSGHAGGEYLMRHKLEHGELGSTDDAVEIAIQRFKEETAAEAIWDDTTPNPNVAQFQLRRIVVALADFGKSINPKAVELELRADAGDGFDLTGHIDLVTVEDWVRDWKMGALHRPYESQLGGYSLLTRSAGINVRGTAIDWIARTPKTKPQPPVQTTEYKNDTCERAAWATVQRIKRDVILFRQTGDPWSFPASNMSMMCTAKYCPAHGTKFCDMGR